MRFEQIRCVDIRPDPRSHGYQPHEVEPLAESVRLFGVLRPVLLRATADGYTIVHGERRWRAAQMIGLERIPAILVQGPMPDERVAPLQGLEGACVGRFSDAAAASTRYELEAIDD
jgi:ParB family chromosome partitioning protein